MRLGQNHYTKIISEARDHFKETTERLRHLVVALAKSDVDETKIAVVIN